jgi:poly-gamma-glutamate system protein
MKKREDKVGRSVLILFTLLAIVLFIFEMGTKHNIRARYFEEKLKAGQIFQEAMKKVKQERERLAIPIDIINDPNETGIIGAQYTPITFQRSDLSASLTSTNPNFVAILVELLKKLKLKEGDEIAVGLDGSYPAANLALYSAMRTLGIKPVIISSVSSSMWGANIPNFTWLDIEYFLYQEKLFPFKSAAATPGGEDELGRGFSPAARTQLDSDMLRTETQLLMSENLDANIKKRVEYYQSKGRIKAFINIGKSIANLGENRVSFSTGLIRRTPKNIEVSSVIKLMLEHKIPVININDINKLATRYGLPIAPVPLPELGKGRLFTEKQFSQVFAIVFSLIIIIALFFVIEYDLEYYLRKKREL